MVDTTLIREHMPVVDCGGRHVGTVDDLDAGRIKLTRAGSADGPHHYIPLADISSIDDDKVMSQLTLEEIEALFRGGEGREHTEG
ncbi:DUF2171 domain-containing protein [Pararoseomonas sp. SCSIO 73927]|uniref:DUF2171 domain-containing protein n=1 Tax=Pararoseomonas sp. SCSIO 73927 TaxID=3114537 RepID=UPI0030D418FA